MTRSSLAMLAIGLGATSARADDWWGADKALHFGVCAALSGASSAGAAAFVDGRLDRASIGLLTGLGAGIAKEVLDALGAGTPSLRDLTWDLAGALVGTLIAFVIERWLVTPLLDAAAPRFAG